MIQLHGLTQRQVDLLDIIWSIDSMSDVEVWIDTLSDADRIECYSLMQLLAIEVLDSTITDSKIFPEASQVINHIMAL